MQSTAHRTKLFLFIPVESIGTWSHWLNPKGTRYENTSKALRPVCARDVSGGNCLHATGLSLDKAVDEPKKYAKTEGIAWQQGFLGDWSKATLPARHGVEGIPAIFLVDPAGKIVAMDLRGAEIGKVVGHALGKAEQSGPK